MKVDPRIEYRRMSSEKAGVACQAPTIAREHHFEITGERGIFVRHVIWGDDGVKQVIMPEDDWSSWRERQYLVQKELLKSYNELPPMFGMVLNRVMK